MSEVRRPQAWVATVPPELAEGKLKEVYDWQSQRLGGPPIHAIGQPSPRARVRTVAPVQGGRRVGVEPYGGRETHRRIPHVH